MVFHRDDSGSEDDEPTAVETSVLLGVPDGPIKDVADITDAAVSRIGGLPAFLPSREPPFSSSQCKVCSQPAELLVQMWCPFEDSPMDRALYVWGCAQSQCQGKEGSVRAWRGLRRNDAYATKLEKKLTKKRADEVAKARAAVHGAEKNYAPRINPFTISSSGSMSGAFSVDNQLFGHQSPHPARSNSSPGGYGNTADDDDQSNAESGSCASDEGLVTAIASVTLADSPWISAPSYPPIYLSTVVEYLPPLLKPKVPLGVQVSDPLDDNERKGNKDISWATEAYEHSLRMDCVFERFTKRVSCEGEQCIRYELSGTPLPYSSDVVFNVLFPAPPAPNLPVTKAAFAIGSRPKRTYFPTSVPPCPLCRSRRVFECQLMPNLINVLRRPEDPKETKITEEKRRKVIERMVRGSTDADRGMEWGTCIIFSCEKDCCLDTHGAAMRDSWQEEVVFIQAAI